MRQPFRFRGRQGVEPCRSGSGETPTVNLCPNNAQRPPLTSTKVEAVAEFPSRGHRHGGHGRRGREGRGDVRVMEGVSWKPLRGIARLGLPGRLASRGGQHDRRHHAPLHCGRDRRGRFGGLVRLALRDRVNRRGGGQRIADHGLRPARADEYGRGPVRVRLYPQRRKPGSA